MAAATHGPFTEAHGIAHGADAVEREALLRKKIGELGLRISGSRLEPLIAKLYAELEGAGISLRPRVFLSDEWGCPDGIPIIGVPFYLVSDELSAMQREYLDYIEAESDAEILAYLRHETGHAFNYAHRLFESEAWHALFGPYSRPYSDDYVPTPFSRSFVRHIPGWYAQKHPDEDFAETFAVWLTPNADWRKEYAGWDCLPKLEYVERVVARYGRAEPAVQDDYDDALELDRPLSEYFAHFGFVRSAVPDYFDGDLRRMFADDRASDTTCPAAEFIRAERKALVQRVAYWTGLSEHVLRSLLDHLAERADQLGLTLPRASAQHASDLTVYVTALAMNRIHHGDFVAK